MNPTARDKLKGDAPDNGQFAGIDEDRMPTKEEIMDGIREDLIYILSGGKAEPIGDMHREIAEELAREGGNPDALRSLSPQ